MKIISRVYKIKGFLFIYLSISGTISCFITTLKFLFFHLGNYVPFFREKDTGQAVVWGGKNTKVVSENHPLKKNKAPRRKMKGNSV